MPWLVVMCVAPFFVLVVVFGAVVVVALLRADRQDVPTVLRETAGVFLRFAETRPEEKA